MVRSRLSNISVGEYISSPMINFISASLQDKHSTFSSAMFRSKGIICEFSKTGSYSNELEVYAGDGGYAAIRRGSFITPEAKIVNVPQVQTTIPLSNETNILIKYVESIFVPECTVSGNTGELTLSYSNADLSNLIVPGMHLLLKSAYEQGDRIGFEIEAVGSNLVLKEPLQQDIVNEEFTIIPRFSSSVYTDESAFCYRFDTFRIASTAANPGVSFDSSWILLATVRLQEGVYVINNIRVPYYGTAPESEGQDLDKWLPNVASIRSAYDTTIEQAINLFFTEGVLEVGSVSKNIFNLSHEQNTDVGTSNPFFDINTQNGVFRLGDVDNMNYLVRLFSERTSKSDYELPSGNIFQHGNSNSIVLSATNISQKLYSMKAFNEVTVSQSGQTTAVLPSSSNMFILQGNSVLNTILFAQGSDMSQQTGQFLFFRATEELTLTSGGNIYGPYLTSSPTDENAFKIPAGQTFCLLNYNGAFYLLSSAAALWRMLDDYKTATNLRLNTFTQSIHDAQTTATTALDTTTTFTQSLSTLQNNLGLLSNKVTAIYSMSGALIGDQNSNIVTKVQSIEATCQDLQNQINNIKVSAIPPRTILAIDLLDPITSHFGSDGVALENSPYAGFALCDGQSNRPNLCGRTLFMANSGTGLGPQAWASKTGSVISELYGKQISGNLADVSQAGASGPTVNGCTPTIPKLEKGSYAGQNFMYPDTNNVPEHTHWTPIDHDHTFTGTKGTVSVSGIAKANGAHKHQFTLWTTGGSGYEKPSTGTHTDKNPVNYNTSDSQNHTHEVSASGLFTPSGTISSVLPSLKKQSSSQHEYSSYKALSVMPSAYIVLFIIKTK